MKPVLIYTLPRTRATVLLYSCRRAIVKDEMFADFNLDIDSFEGVKIAFYKLEDSNTVCKIHGRHLSRAKFLSDWYHRVLDLKIYDVFVVERPDRLNTFLSLILAERFGYNKRDEIEAFEFEVTDKDIELVESEIKYYLDFYPSYGRIVSLDSYPLEYFDSFLINDTDQESHKKYQYIQNFEWTVQEINRVLAKYENTWQDKINKLNEKNN